MPANARPLVVFDLDGTLADTAPDLVGTLNVLLAREGLPPLPVAEARHMIGAGARALLERGLSAAGRIATPDRLDELYRAFLAHYADNLCAETRLYPGVVRALDRLEDDGCRFAVCTNKIESHAVRLLEGLGVADRFSAVCGRDTFHCYKPDPRHLTLTIAQAGGRIERAVMVGDSITDIATARAAGVPVVAVTFGYTERPVQAFDPDRVIEDFDELPDAVGGLVGLLAVA